METVLCAAVGTASHQHWLEACTVYVDRTVCSCRHSKSSAWVRSICYVWRIGCSQPSRCELNWLTGLFVFHFRERTAWTFLNCLSFVIYWRRNIGSHLTGDTDSFVYMKGYWCMIQRFKPNHHNWTDLLHKERKHAHTHTAIYSRSPVTCNDLNDVCSFVRQTTASGTVRQFQYGTERSQTQFYTTELDCREGSVRLMPVSADRLSVTFSNGNCQRPLLT